MASPSPAKPNGDFNTGDLTGAKRDAAVALMDLFNQYSLGTLGPKIVDYIKQGYSADTIQLLLQETTEWKTRFAGNEARRKKGMPVLSPAEYLATERSYAQVLSTAGFPSGFYDTPADFAGMIGRDMSPSELQNRANTYIQFANNHDPEATKAAQDLYGFGPGEIAAYVMDPARALPLLQRQANAVGVATAAMHNGMGTSRDRAEYLTDRGITGQQAEQGYSQVAQLLPTFRELGRIYGEQYGQNEAENDVLLGDAGATATRKRLASAERGAFGGRSSGSTGSASKSY